MKQEDFVIHHCELTWRHLQEYPVWTDADDGDSGMIQPLVSDRPFESDFDTLTLRARFKTVNGNKLLGNAVYDSVFRRVYLIEIYAGSEGVPFNKNLSSLIPMQLERLQEALGIIDDPIFPVEFETDAIDADGERYRGVFDPMR